MDKNHLDADFARVGELYDIYKKALLNKENNASAIEVTKQKIVGEFWKITQKVKSFTPEMKENSVLIVKTITSCLKTYTDKKTDEFCKLTFASIKNKLSGMASTSAFEEKTGMHITDPEDRIRKRIEKAYKQYALFNKDDKRAFMDYAIKYQNFDKEDLEMYLFPTPVKSLFMKNKAGEEFCVGDVEGAITVDSDNEDEEKENFEAQLQIINDAWEKQKDDAKDILSELITSDLLNDFSKSGNDIKIANILRKYAFINTDIMDAFFDDSKYKLPTQQEIANKYGLTKSAVSVKLSRFIKGIMEKKYVSKR